VASLSLLLVGLENVSVDCTCLWLFVTGCHPHWGLGSSVDSGSWSLGAPWTGALRLQEACERSSEY
jgi:hypothetical protein